MVVSVSRDTRTEFALTAIFASAVVSIFFIGWTAVQEAYADTAVWTGDGDGINWTDPDNWSIDVFVYSDDIRIPGGYTVHLGGIDFTVINLTIQAGATLIIDEDGGLFVSNYDPHTRGIINEGTLINNGLLGVENSGGSFSGIYSDGGTIINNGELYVRSTYTAEFGIFNYGGTFTNFGTINVDDAHGPMRHGIDNLNGGTIINYGEMKLSNTGNPSAGILNAATITNEIGGVINVVNSGDSSGIVIDDTPGFLTNLGTMIVANTGGTGILNGGTLDNLATLIVANTGGTGIDNEATFTSCGEEITDNPINATTYFVCLQQSVDSLVQQIVNEVTATNVESSLLGPLRQVDRILSDNNPSNDGSACGKLDEFIATVDSKEASGKLSHDLAEKYREEANAIKAEIGC